MIEWIRRHSLLAGLVLIFAFTWPVDLGAVAYSRGWIPAPVPEPVSLLVGYGIVIAAILTTALVSGRTGVRALLRRFLIWRVGWIWYAVVLGLPPVLLLLSIALHSLATQTAPDFGQFFAQQIFGPEANPWYLLLPYFLFALLTNAEEIGWRGFVLPRLEARLSPLGASLILGAIWAVWHLPRYFILNTTLGGGRGPEDFPIEAVKILANAILYTWVFNRTHGSLLLVTLFHASWNTAWVLLPMMDKSAAETVIAWLAAAVVVMANLPAWLARPKGTVGEQPTAASG